MKARKVVKKILSPFESYIHVQTLSGILLLLAAIIAMVLANSPWAEYYFDFWETHITLSIGDFELDESILHWINDGLMAMFFFVVGLEIKREVMVGELSTIKKAALPVLAAVGGMVVPALFYAALNYDTPTSAGWGVPMATDIAFSLGVLALLGSRVKLSLKIFLIALAIADDIGAVSVIAFFYSSDISMGNLGLGAVFLAVMLLGDWLNIRNAYFYAFFGIGGLWLAFLLSGVHPSIAGILAAISIPANSKLSNKEFIANMQKLITKFRTIPNSKASLLNEKQLQYVKIMEETRDNIEPPLQRLERRLHPIVTFGVMPLFALANAGVAFSGNVGETLVQPVSIGIILGLLIGKVVGIVLFVYIATKLGIASLPANMTWANVIGLGFLAGIGFTMSLFISGLAFSDPLHVDAAKLGILLGSLLSGLVGFFILRWSLKSDE